jgi:hypothetical protein
MLEQRVVGRAGRELIGMAPIMTKKGDAIAFFKGSEVPLW